MSRGDSMHCRALGEDVNVEALNSNSFLVTFPNLRTAKKAMLLNARIEESPASFAFVNPTREVSVLLSSSLIRQIP